MRKIFLENLPKNNEGRHKGCINWDKSKNKKCRFVYDDIEGYIKYHCITYFSPVSI